MHVTDLSCEIMRSSQAQPCRSLGFISLVNVSPPLDAVPSAVPCVHAASLSSEVMRTLLRAHRLPCLLHCCCISRC